MTNPPLPYAPSIGRPGLLAKRVVEVAPVPDTVRAAVLIGVGLGPNLSITGSLAALKLGALTMPPALLLALAATLLN